MTGNIFVWYIKYGFIISRKILIGNSYSCYTSIATGVLSWPGNICICAISQWIHTIHLDLVISCSVIRQWLLTVHLDLVLVCRVKYQLDTDGSSWPGNLMTININ